MIDPHIAYKSWKGEKSPKKILIIRLQAIGDVVIMLPYIESLREKLPKGTIIDLLTRKEAENIPTNLQLFDTVYSLGGGRNTKKQLLWFLFMYPRLLLKNYDILLDLQNHNLSKVIRFLLRIKSWSVFDRTSTNYAGDRYKNTINALNIVDVQFKKITSFKKTNEAEFLLKYGLTKGEEYVVINPAGAFDNRNWQLDNYVAFCKLWLEKVNSKTKFIVLGISKITEKATYFQEKLGDNIINLVDKTSAIDAMRILKHVKLVVSEDSGLLHMSYAVGTPSIGILGSTRNDWTNPNLPHTYFFNSSDLPCGNCMLEKCKFDEIICLPRIKPEDVLNAAIDLLKKSEIK